jgi:hypothetical protein
MQVTIKYHDDSALTPDEVVAHAKRMYGQSATIRVLPDSPDTYSLLYFAIQKIITNDQIDALFHDKALYPESVDKLKNKAYKAFEEALVQVLRDNEERIE